MFTNHSSARWSPEYALQLVFPQPHTMLSCARWQGLSIPPEIAASWNPKISANYSWSLSFLACNPSSSSQWDAHGRWKGSHLSLLWKTCCPLNFHVLSWPTRIRVKTLSRSYHQRWKKERHLLDWIKKWLLLLDADPHLASWTRSHKQSGIVEGLSLITDHIDLRFDLRLIILIRSEYNSHKIRDAISWFMSDSKLFLQCGSHLCMTFTYHHIVIRLREEPSHTLERQASYNWLQFGTFFLL